MTLPQYFTWLQNTYGDNWMDQLPGDFAGKFDLATGANNLYNQTIWDYAKGKYGDDYKGLQGYLTSVGGFTYNPEWEQWLQNMVASQNTDEARDWEQIMRDSELTSTAGQLTSLGLNPASVVSMGRGSVPNVAAADVAHMDSVKQRAQFRFDQKENMLKRVFSILGGMASAGIGGAAYGTARGIAARMSRSTMKSARRAFSSGRISSPEMFHGHPVSESDWDDILKEISMQ